MKFENFLKNLKFCAILTHMSVHDRLFLVIFQEEFMGKKRYALPDTIRGVILISMIAYHTVWDMVHIFGKQWKWFDYLHKEKIVFYNGLADIRQ